MQLKPTHDARIQALGYDEDTWTCYVQFPPTERQPEGTVYAFAAVPPELFDDLESAPSPIRFFEQHLARNPEHPFTRLGEDASERKQSAQFSSPEEAVATAQRVAREAESLAITTPEAYRAAGEELVRLAGERRRRVEFFRPMKEAAFAAHRVVCARENEALAPLRQAETALSAGLVAYRREEERNRRAQQEQWNALRALPPVAGLPGADEWSPANRSAMPAPSASQPLVAVQPSGEPFSPPVPAEQPTEVFVAPVLAREVPNVAGLSFAKDWDFEVVEPAQVPLSHEWYSLDEKKLRAYVKRMREHASIPGVRVFPKERSRARVA